jgi:hypothetical protein
MCTKPPYELILMRMFRYSRKIYVDEQTRFIFDSFVNMNFIFLTLSCIITASTFLSDLPIGSSAAKLTRLSALTALRIYALLNRNATMSLLVLTLALIPAGTNVVRPNSCFCELPLVANFVTMQACFILDRPELLTFEKIAECNGITAMEPNMHHLCVFTRFAELK